MINNHTGAVYRHEYKYLSTETQRAVLKTRANGLLKKDVHSKESGGYRVRSLYFDNLYNRCYSENEAGVDNRDKYRIRIYDNDSGYILLEKKSKQRQMTLKTSCVISEEICRKLMNREPIVLDDSMTAKQRQLLAELQYQGMRPVVIVDYMRYAYVEKNGNVRITFDENLSSSGEVTRFLEKDIILRPILDIGKGIIEVKWDELVPDYIKRNMQLADLQWSSFSKYFLCRKYNTYGGVRL